MRDDRHLHMLLMGCKAGAEIKPGLYIPCSSELGEGGVVRGGGCLGTLNDAFHKDN